MGRHNYKVAFVTALPPHTLHLPTPLPKYLSHGVRGREYLMGPRRVDPRMYSTSSFLSFLFLSFLIRLPLCPIIITLI